MWAFGSIWLPTRNYSDDFFFVNSFEIILAVNLRVVK